MKRLLAVWLMTFGMLVAANEAVAQGDNVPRAPRVEVWGAVTGVMTGPAGSLVSSYSPPLLFDGDFTSRGGQTLRVETGATVGLTGGVNVFPSRRVGIQMLFDRASFAVSGTNTAYTVALQYVSRPPPDNVPRIVNVDHSVRHRMLLVQQTNQLVLVDAKDGGGGHCRCASHADGLSRQAPFAKKVSGAEHRHDSLFSRLRDDRDLHVTRLDVQHAVAGIALDEDDLVLLVLHQRPSQSR
ncbi:MAG: hypothetical protein ABL986_07730 [Vicinamibacterales bacterium]